MSLPHPEFFALLSFYNRLHRELESRLKKYGLTPAAFHALQEIAARTGPRQQPPTRAKIARAIGVTPGSMSVLIRRLINAKRVLASPIDDRSFGLVLTPKGVAALHGASVAWEDTIAPWNQILSATTKRHFLHGIALYNDEALEQQGQRRHEFLMRMFSKHKHKARMKKSEMERRRSRRRLPDPE